MNITPCAKKKSQVEIDEKYGDEFLFSNNSSITENELENIRFKSNWRKKQFQVNE